MVDGESGHVGQPVQGVGEQQQQARGGRQARPGGQNPPSPKPGLWPNYLCHSKNFDRLWKSTFPTTFQRNYNLVSLKISKNATLQLDHENGLKTTNPEKLKVW